MSQRIQLILLAALLCILAVLAFVLRPWGNSSAPRAAASGEGALGALAGGAGGADASRKTPPPHLSVAELRELNAWFASKGEPSHLLPPSSAPIFGLERKAPPAPAPQAPRAAEATFVEPPRLEGILWIGSVGMALFQGESYQPGEKIRGTAYRVISVSPELVRLERDDGREIALNWHK